MAGQPNPDSLEESSWDHARRETRRATTSLWFWVADAVFSIVAATATLLILLKWGPQNVFVIAGVPAAVGIAWLFAIVLAVLTWHLLWAPYRQRDALREYIIEQLPTFPNVEIEKHAVESHGMRDRYDKPAQLFILRRVRITNRDEQKVSLGFKLNVTSDETLHLGIPNVLGQMPLPQGPFGTPPLQQFQAPLDLEPRSSVLGNIVFVLSAWPEESTEETPAEEEPREPSPPADVELELVDYISGTSVRFSPSAGYPHPADWPKRKELADRPTRRTVGHVAS